MIAVAAGDSFIKARPRRSLWTGCVATGLVFVATCAFAQDDLGYDSAADPFAQLAEARAQAATQGKHILVIAGGDWCIWCHWLDAFLKSNPDVDAPLEDTFVVLKVYFGGPDTNEAFFATLPEALGYPHFWILNAEGKLLASQNTVELEDGDKSYDKASFMTFIKKWKETL